MRDKKVWEDVNKMPTYTKKSNVSCELVEELHDGYKIMSIRTPISIISKKVSQYQVDQHTTKEIERLVGYKDEYIG
tara:strand:- start:1058 stop:1285 length:228 start_codon:yes stop_codon:yes gene_type:complete